MKNIAFRNIKLDDKEDVERIRLKYQPELSDYTFALLYCWQEEMELTIHIEEDFYVVKSREYFFFPIGQKKRVVKFVNELMEVGILPSFRFCDNKMLELIERNYSGRYEYFVSDNDSDYVVENKTINELLGSKFAKRRNEFSHYSNLSPKPCVEEISEKNIDSIALISKSLSGMDRKPEIKAIEHFFELDMIGIIVKRGKDYVGFSICSKKDEKTMQGHFMKSMSTEKGSKFFLMKSCIDAFSDRFDYTNMEDDMGKEGLRKFKSSFEEKIVSSYTIQFKKEGSYE